MQNEITCSFISFCVDSMRLVRNEIIISFCTDGKHIFLISFCGGIMRSVLNDKYVLQSTEKPKTVQSFEHPKSSIQFKL